MSENNYTPNNNSEDTNKPSEKAKIPAQIFQWFDSIRQGYESSINKLFHRVEKVNEDHKEQIKSVYQSQIDGLKKTYQDHLHSLKSNNQSQAEQAQSRIKQLEKDAQFYQDQIKTQNQTIDKLNDRYDAVIFALKDKMDNKELENVIKDISPTNDESSQASLTDSTTPAPSQQHSTDSRTDSKADSKTENSANSKAEQNTQAKPVKAQTQDDNLQEQQTQDTMNGAFNARQDKQYELAYELFYSAAIQGNEKAMGAIGRAHFVGEGVPQNKTIGLAWLIKAAEHQFEPAIKKVAGAEQKSPELYQSALQISAELF